MVFLVVLLATLCSTAAVSALFVLVVVPRLRDDEARAGASIVAAAAEAASVEAARALASERQATVESAVDTVVKVASSKLGDTVAAGTRELDLRSRSFDKQVEQVSSALGELGRVVNALQHERAEQTGSLVAQLEQVSKSQQALADHTEQLRNALASPKQRGQWGERMAEDVLRAAGFREGVNFRRQSAIPGGTIPDFRFLLPRDLELRMDVKFPIDNYLRVLESDDEAIRSRFTKAFVQDVRGHIRGLAGRGYIDPSDTVDCLLLFIPNEAVYAFLHEADPTVVDVALEQQVVLCSPGTLFAVLAVVRRSVEQFQLERRSDEILRSLGSVVAEWDKLGGSIDKLGRQLDTVAKTFHDEVNGTRRRQFQRSLDTVEGVRDGAELADAPVGEALVARKAAGDVRPLPLDFDGVDGPAERGAG